MLSVIIAKLAVESVNGWTVSSPTHPPLTFGHWMGALFGLIGAGATRINQFAWWRRGAQTCRAT